MAASTFCPLLVLGIWWRGLTAAGAVAGLLTGGAGSVAAVAWTLADDVAAVIVEPVPANMGLVPPEDGFLAGLRAECDRVGAVLIFDEVITGFGRLGTPFAADFFGVTPDLMTTAKGITNGTIPCGAVFASRKVHDGLMVGPENQMELFHGYTYSAHPTACAAGIATPVLRQAYVHMQAYEQRQKREATAT